MKFDSPVARATLLVVQGVLTDLAEELRQEDDFYGLTAIETAKDRIHAATGNVLAAGSFEGDQFDRALQLAKPPRL
jgi:hypothetical protein